MKRIATGIFAIIIIIFIYQYAIHPTFIAFQEERAHKSIEHLLNDPLNNQLEIVEHLMRSDVPIENTGYLVLPEHPYHYTPIHQLVEHDVPLFLQLDKQYRHLPYGSDGSQELWENGCAIVTLAMLESYFSNNNITPADILDWSQETYYLDNQGTSWKIFADYAEHYGRKIENYKQDLFSALEGVGRDGVAVVSVGPGHFTEVGHFMVIRGFDGTNVYINDPNDDPQKMHSIQPIPYSLLMDSLINVWVFYA